MIFRRGFIAVLVVTIAWLQVRVWIGHGSLAEVNMLDERVQHEQVDNEVRQQRNSVLRAEVMDLKNGVAAIEEKARSELGLVKQGETFFLLVDHRQAPDKAAANDKK